MNNSIETKSPMLYLDFNQKSYKTVLAKEYDQGSRFVPIQCTLNGQKYSVDSSAYVEVRVLTPDDRALSDIVAVQSDGTLLLELTETMLWYPGKANVEIVIYDTSEKNKRLSTMCFNLIIEAAVYSEDRVVATDEFNALTELINKVTKDYDYVITECNKSASNAKTSETNAKTYMNNANTYKNNAATSATNSANSAKLSQSWAVGGTSSRDGEDTNNSKYYATQSANSASASKTSETNAKSSETKAKTSETNASNSASSASTSATNASNSASSASTSADIATTKASEASTSATNASKSEVNAKTYMNNASSFATSANTSAETATTKASEASTSASNAKTYATNASNSATTSQNYAIGNTNSAKYYYEQAKMISESFSGALKPMGTVTFTNLPPLSEASDGDMYNISDQFTTTDDFREGSGFVIPIGSNVYKTSDGKWDVLAGTPVTGVKGNSESSYRTGNINLTANDIGAAASSHTHNYAGSSSPGGSANSLSYFKNTSTTSVGIDDTSANAIGYVSGVGSILGTNDGAMYKQVYSDAWAHEIFGDYVTGQIAVRGKNNGTWQAWRKILDSSNYTSYCTPANIGAATSSHTHTAVNGVTPEWVGSISFADTNALAAWNSDGTKIKALDKNSFATASHTHNYAGSSSAGGSATSAVKLDTSSAGSTTQPVYFSGGKPVACTGLTGITSSLASTSTTIALSASAGTNLQGQIDTINSNLGYPDYAGYSELKTINDSSSHTDESVTISNNGFVLLRVANGSTATSIFWRLKINNFSVSEGYTITRNYNYGTTAAYPVKKGDVVKLSCSNQTSARLYFFPLRKA